MLVCDPNPELSLPLPDLVDAVARRFYLSERFGFLIGEQVGDLAEYYNPWVFLARRAPDLIRDRTLRQNILEMPELSTDYLVNHRDYRHAHVVLSVLTAGYVWQDGETNMCKVLPRQLAVPFCAISSHIGLPPVVLHDSLACANFRLINPSKPPSLENMRLMYLLPGGAHCEWFFLVTMQVELNLTSSMLAIIEIVHYLEVNDKELLVSSLDKLHQSVAIMRKTFLRMHDGLNAEVFYNTIRPFLNGWDNEGLVYEGVSDKPKKYFGGSAAQCAGIQAIDIILGIQHKSSDKKQFLLEMQNYMLPVKRQFLEWLASLKNVKDFVESTVDDKVTAAYNRCVQAMTDLRSSHIQIVARYVTIQSHRQTNDFETLQTRGTGGQDLIPFLKGIRSTTQQSIVK